jgi:hypothetical protein
MHMLKKPNNFYDHDITKLSCLNICPSFQKICHHPSYTRQYTLKYILIQRNQRREQIHNLAKQISVHEQTINLIHLCSNLNQY